jgi:site-specific recombinase XerD
METIKSSRIIDTAKGEVTDFRSMFERLEQKVILGGLSNSTLLNYGRCIAKISLHFKCIPTQLDEEQINGYLQYLLTKQKPSKSYFKHTVYGLRFLFRIYDLEDRIIKLPSLKTENKLPVVLSPKECKRLFAAGRILKHRVLLSLVYSAGLRSKEVRNLKLSDIDFDRLMIHIRQTKYNKDRYVPLSSLMVGGLHKYMAAYNPKIFLFNGQSIGSPLSAKGVQWAMRQTIKRAKINKEATIHSLRHSYATHLLEFGMDIDTLSKLLGHAHLNTTLIYLHVARLQGSSRFSPFDRIYTAKTP